MNKRIYELYTNFEYVDFRANDVNGTQRIGQVHSIATISVRQVRSRF